MDRYNPRDNHNRIRSKDHNNHRRRSRDRESGRYNVKQNRSRSPRNDERRDRDYSPRSKRKPSSDREDSYHDRSPSRSSPPKRRRHDDKNRGRESRSRSPRRHHHRSHHASQESRFRKPPPHPPSQRSHAPLPSQNDAFSKTSTSDAIAARSPPPEKQKPNYAPSGVLAAESNTVANTNIVLKYNEPPESRLPPSSQPWRLYVFKDSEVLDTLPLHTRTCWLFGREKLVVDHLTEHPSCSKQHAVLQFRYTEKRDEWGERKGRVRLYVLDLESANGTRLNGDAMPGRRYVEVKSGDVVKFGESTREYVALLPPKEKERDESKE